MLRFETVRRAHLYYFNLASVIISRLKIKVHCFEQTFRDLKSFYGNGCFTLTRNIAHKTGVPLNETVPYINYNDNHLLFQYFKYSVYGFLAQFSLMQNSPFYPVSNKISISSQNDFE